LWSWGPPAVVFTHGADGGGNAGAEQVSYGGVRNVLAALHGRRPRIALMTAIGVTNRTGSYNPREAGDPSDGVVSRAQIAQVLVRSLTSASATGKTFELVAERGPATEDFDALLGALYADTAGELDAVRDAPDMPLPQEPERVREDLRQLIAREAREA